MKKNLLSSLLVALLFPLGVFAEEGELPCPGVPQDTPSSTPSTPSDSGPSNSHVSTTPSDAGGDAKDQLGITLNPDQQQGGGSSMGTLGGGDNKKPFGHSEFMSFMRAYLDHARREIKAKEKELKEKAAFRKMESSVGLKSKLHQAEEAFNDLVKAHGRLGKVEGKVKELEKELKKEQRRLAIDIEVRGVAYRLEDVNKVKSRLDELMPEYNAAQAELKEASENYDETHDILNQAFEDMAEMEANYQARQNAPTPKPQD